MSENNTCLCGKGRPYQRKATGGEWGPVQFARVKNLICPIHSEEDRVSKEQADERCREYFTKLESASAE